MPRGSGDPTAIRRARPCEKSERPSATSSSVAAKSSAVTWLEHELAQKMPPGASTAAQARVKLAVRGDGARSSLLTGRETRRIADDEIPGVAFRLGALEKRKRIGGHECVRGGIDVVGAHR